MDFDIEFPRSPMIRLDGPLTNGSKGLGYAYLVLFALLAFKVVPFSYPVLIAAFVAIFGVVPLIAFIRYRLMKAEELYFDALLNAIQQGYGFHLWGPALQTILDRLDETGRVNGQWVMTKNGKPALVSIADYRFRVNNLINDVNTFQLYGATAEITVVSLRGRLTNLERIAGSVPNRWFLSHYGMAQGMLTGASLAIIGWFMLIA